ncbi:MAG: metalloregulator ArsR/SmtB family transcription factor [Marinilabiliales bacterium]
MYKIMNNMGINLTEQELEVATNMLKAIAHPQRLAIINLLENGKNLNVTEIYTALNIEQSVASHHLGILKDKGIVSAKRMGKNTLYSLRHEQLNALISCIKTCAKTK